MSERKPSIFVNINHLCKLQHTIHSSMASNTDKGIETTNAEGVKEKVVNTVEYRSPAGEDQPTKKENVQIVHETKPGDETSGVLSAATAAVTNTINSAKDAIKK